MRIPMTMRAFVTGATGLVGHALVTELRRQGVPTVAHVRPDSKQLPRWRETFERDGAEVDITPWQLEAMTETLRHRAVLLAGAAGAVPAVERYVYLSSAGASPKAAGAYLQWRWKAEEAVRASGVAWTIARPSIIVGDRDDARPLEDGAAKVLDGLLVAVGALGGATWRDRYRSTDGATLARALARLARDPAAANQTFESEQLRD
jgi:uncharacterized protein YbjT (DUF2867 family)